MSRPRFLADNDFNDDIVLGLLRREPAIVIVRIREVQLDRVSDAVVLDAAAVQDLIVVSHDLHTMPAACGERLVARHRMPGVLLVPQHMPVGAAIEQMLVCWVASEHEEWEGMIRYLPL